MNKSLKWMLGAVAVAAVCASGAAQAARVGVFIGGPVFAPYYPVVPVAPAYYGYPAGYPAYPEAAPYGDEQPEYVEQGQGGAPAGPDAGAAPEPQGNGGTWYYCPASKTYYPYVKSCASGWREVPAQPQ